MHGPVTLAALSRLAGGRMLLLVLAVMLAGLHAPSAAGAAVTPENGVTYEAGVTIELPCEAPTAAPKVHASSSTLYRADPAWKQALVYPASAAAFNPVKWKATTGVATRTFVNVKPSGPCGNFTIEANGTTDGAPVVLWTPGYYTVRWFVIDELQLPLPTGRLPPDVATCKDDVGGNPYITAISEDNANGRLVFQHCRHFKTISFTVLGDPGTACKDAGYVGPFYFNQYASGSKYGLPSDQFGVRGGNACGPSSVAMALHLRGETHPNVAAAYAGVMSKPAKDGQENYLDGAKTKAYLRSLGYQNARVVEFKAPTDVVAPDNEQVHGLLDGHEGPVILSTTFAAGPWSERGAGHIILVVSRVPARGAGPSPGDYIVRDPAGDFFARPDAKHYGATICGMDVRYPARWIGAMTVTQTRKAGWIGKYAVVLGPKTTRSQLAAAISAQPATHPTEVLFTLRNDDTDAWIETTQHAKAGFIGGAKADNLAGVDVDVLPTFLSDPGSGGSPPAAATPERTILLDTPGAGLSLRVRGRGRGRDLTTIEMLVYQRGRIVQRKTLHLKLSRSTTTALRIPSYGGVKPTTKPKLTISAKSNGHGGLTITGRAPFPGQLLITITAASGLPAGAGIAQIARAGSYSTTAQLFSAAPGRLTVDARLTGPKGTVKATTTVNA